VFALCANINISNAQVNVQDSLALVDLYNSTDGPHWFRNQNWKSGPVSTWAGIEVTNNRVTLIQMGKNNLRGNIPSTIGNLSNLQRMDLNTNQLNGSIPPSIGNLKSLIYFYLLSNQLSSSIPRSIGDLINLQGFDLSDNELSDSIPSSLGNLINLQGFDLSDNELSDSIPSSLGNLKTLVGLDLDNNQLSGSIPSSLGNLSQLYILRLDNNQLSGSIPSSLGSLKTLGFLELNNNQLSGSIPSSLGNLVNLYYLYLNNNQLTGRIPSSLGNLVNLYILDLGNNRLSGTIPSSLSNLNLLNDPSYGYLNLSHNHLTFDGMELIAQTFPNAVYAPQKRIPIHQNGNTLSVSAGGTLSNNTYKWYRFRKEGDTIVIKGDSVFHPAQNGKYLVRVKNAVATQLTLYSDSIVYIAPAVVASAQNALQQYDKRNLFGVYPNPAKDILFVQTNSNASFSLLNQSGKILLTTNINGMGSINVSGIAAGLYYLKNNSSGAVQKVIISR